MPAQAYSWCRLLALGLCALTMSAAWAQEQPQIIDREFEIKAAYLYNFGLYVKWPKGAVPGNDPKFIIGVLGKDRASASLDKVAETKKVDDKKVVIQRFKSMEDYKPCHILFISGAAAGEKDEKAEERLAAALKQIKGKPVLIVTENEGLALKGAVINFFVDDNRVKFEINPEAAKGQGLEVSSKLLQLGKIVPKKE